VYKIELWLKTTDETAANKIRQKLSDALKDGTNARPPEFDFSKRK
jgi:hypothetical protein